METPPQIEHGVSADGHDESEGLAFRAEAVCPTFDLGVTA